MALQSLCMCRAGAVTTQLPRARCRQAAQQSAAARVLRARRLGTYYISLLVFRKDTLHADRPRSNTVQDRMRTHIIVLNLLMLREARSPARVVGKNLKGQCPADLGTDARAPARRAHAPIAGLVALIGAAS